LIIFEFLKEKISSFKTLSIKNKIILSTLTSFVFIFIVFLSYAFFYVSSLRKELPSVEKILTHKHSLPSVVISADNIKIGEFFNERRYPVKLSKINKQLLQAFIAAEDSSFYQHKGIDHFAILRAGFFYIFSSSKAKQGGSTITQQLAKTLLLTREKTIHRKVKDMLLAQEIEKKFSKDQILELYLNTIFLGNNSYGVEAASKNFFKKTNQELTLAEASMIAGLPPAPSAYSPVENMAKAKVRQKFVLDQMFKHKNISLEEMKTALSEKIEVHRAESPNTKAAPFFLMEIKKILEEKAQIKDLDTGGYRIKTTLNYKMQKAAEKAVKDGLKVHSQKTGFKGALKKYGGNLDQGRKEMVQMKPKDVSLEITKRTALVTDMFPSFDLAKIEVMSESGEVQTGVLTVSDHMWALAPVAKAKDKKIFDFADILKIGDLVNVKISDKQIAQRILKNSEIGLSESSKRYVLADKENVEAAFVAMNASSGEVLAMVGGEDFLSNQFNHATQAKRQVGSSVKPLYYTLAMDKGFSPGSLIDAPPIVLGDWKPENYGKEFTGRTTLRTALVLSHNIPSIQIFQTLGSSNLYKLFRLLGLEWPANDMSVALGSGEATLLQMVQAYSPFANQGKLTEANYVTSILDREQKELLPQIQKKIAPAPTGHNGAEIYSPEAAYVGLRLLQDVVRFGTGTSAASVPLAAGKTGTTNGYTDAWFVGVVPGVVSGVWVGFDDQRKSLGSQGTGGKMATPIWASAMHSIQQLKSFQASFSKPDGVVTLSIDTDTGLPSNELGKNIRTIDAVLGSEPGGANAKNILGFATSGKDGNINNSAQQQLKTSDSEALRNMEGE
jgi:penicillin-binding protein 1A